jgi:hypothetical protein
MWKAVRMKGRGFINCWCGQELYAIDLSAQLFTGCFKPSIQPLSKRDDIKHAIELGLPIDPGRKFEGYCPNNLSQK